MIIEPDIMFQVHPFKNGSIFLILRCEYRRKLAEETIYLNLNKKEYYIAIGDSIYSWEGHKLYLINEGVYTIVHKSDSGVKVPCCYDYPNYIKGKTEDAIKYLNLNGWEEKKTYKSIDNVRELVYNKIKEKGMNFNY